MKRGCKTYSQVESKRSASKYFKPASEQRTGLLGNCDSPVIPFEDGRPSRKKKMPVGKRGRKTTKLLADQEADEMKISTRLLQTSAAHCSTAAVELAPLVVGAERFRTGFYDQPCQDLAKQLLGQILVRRLDDGTTLSGRIVETECYLGGEDKASHTYNGRKTESCMPMYMKPGTAYVYMTYGMYHCFNISSREPGAAVLLRALEPLQGLDEMLTQRLTGRKKPREPINELSGMLENSNFALKPRRIKQHELCNGPAKLCISLMIDKKTCNTQDMSEWPGMWIKKSEESDVKEQHIVKTSRIGIDSAGIEWATKPLRFYIIDQTSVSRRNLAAEKELKELASLLKS